MLLPFFALAAVSPARQRAFRSLLIVHLFLLLAGVAVLKGVRPGGVPLLGQVLLIAGIIEGSLLIGWRLTQVPKSLALEFLLVSPVRPWQIFLAELLVGVVRLAYLTLASLPVLLFLVFEGELQFLDLIPLLVMPFTWGCVCGLALTQWAYEPARVRRWGERGLLVLVVLYLLVGVLAGENLRAWFEFSAGAPRQWFLTGFQWMHVYSPFAVIQASLQGNPAEALELLWPVQAIATAVLLGLTLRSGSRFWGHFQDRHYLPAVDPSGRRRAAIGDTPLRWWAIKRVSEYSGWVNLWLAGGFGLLYAAYIVAGPAWPTWLGHSVFVIVDNAGGIPVLTTALVLLAAVPAAFQYGLWDSNAHERLKKLELLLLTRLSAFDYWQAAGAAAWKRGQGYFFVAAVLWYAGGCAGHISSAQILAAASAGIVLWGLYFALGFRAFSRGQQASGLGLVLTLGMPLATYALFQLDLPDLAVILPPGGVFAPTAAAVLPTSASGTLVLGLAALVIGRRALTRCDAELRQWYDRNHGARVLD